MFDLKSNYMREYAIRLDNGNVLFDFTCRWSGLVSAKTNLAKIILCVNIYV